jgi:trehalose-6-phosphate synthase
MNITLPAVAATSATVHPTEIERDLHLPSVNVLSLAGPGSSGGVPLSLAPVVQRLGTRVHWFALSELPAQNFSPAQSQTHSRAKSGFSYHHLDAPPRIINAHAKVVSGYLWDLLHGYSDKNSFDGESWKSYRQLCELAASECITSGSDSFPTLCWIHDYQLALAAPALASQAGLILSQFWHVPWPQANVIADSPIGRELTEAMLHNKLIGFHTEDFVANFLDTVALLYEDAKIDRALGQISWRGRKVTVVAVPLGIDASYWQNLARSCRPMAEAMAAKHGLASQFILGVERLEYTKGVLERLDGLECFLEEHPERQRRFHYVQLSQPPKTIDSQKVTYAEKVEARIAEINARYGQNGWQPIVHIKGSLDHSNLASWYQAAAALSVNSLSDGLNLLSKEYVACRTDEQGVLILSKEAGSARELGQGAILVDPQNKESISKAFNLALTLAPEEKRRRMTAMRHVIGWNQINNWALSFLSRAIRG